MNFPLERESTFFLLMEKFITTKISRWYCVIRDMFLQQIQIPRLFLKHTWNGERNVLINLMECLLLQFMMKKRFFLREILLARNLSTIQRDHLLLPPKRRYLINQRNFCRHIAGFINSVHAFKSNY